MNPYIEILRPANAIMASIAVFLMAIVDGVYNIPILLGIITVFIATGAGNSINDYYDYEIDKINKPQRPIPSGRIKRSVALYYSLILFVISIILGFLISIENGITVIICSVLMILYAYKLKQECLIGNICVSVLTGLTFIFGGLITANIYTGFILGFFAFLMTLSRELIKDSEDVEGDSKLDAHTFPIIYGVDNAVKLAGIINVITCILSPLLYIYHFFSIVYLIIILIADIIFIYSAVKAVKNPIPTNLNKISSYMKIAMIIAFISFALGSIL